ncbi:MAG: TetR/AcrR family transcriptional regulator [Planctomycetota bacterium]|nr:TetR/AcrR family transcriptional regulator [Planctomycetota bacterium]
MSRPIDRTLESRLIEAATERFAASGFAGTRVDEVGLHAGVTKGGVYFRFRSKEALFFAVVDHWREALRREIAGGATGTGADELEGVLRSWLRFHATHPSAARILRVLAAELRAGFTAGLRDDAQADQRAFRARVRECLHRGGSDGSLDCGDPALTAFLLVAAAEGCVAQWLAAPADAGAFRSPEALAEALVVPYRTGFIRGYAAPDDPGAAFTPPI